MRTGSWPGIVSHASPRSTADMDSAEWSSTQIDHGGSMSSWSRNASRARGPSSSPANASMAATLVETIEHGNE